MNAQSEKKVADAVWECTFMTEAFLWIFGQPEKAKDGGCAPPGKECGYETDLFLMDAPSITLTLIYADGSQRRKSIDSGTSMDIYEALLPYFINN